MFIIISLVIVDTNWVWLQFGARDGDESEERRQHAASAGVRHSWSQGMADPCLFSAASGQSTQWRWSYDWPLSVFCSQWSMKVKLWLTPVCFLQPVVNEGEVMADPCLFSAASGQWRWSYGWPLSVFCSQWSMKVKLWLTPVCFLQPVVNEGEVMADPCLFSAASGQWRWSYGWPLSVFCSQQPVKVKLISMYGWPVAVFCSQRSLTETNWHTDGLVILLPGTCESPLWKPMLTVGLH